MPRESMSDCLEKLLVDHIIASFKPFIDAGKILNVKAKSYPWIDWKSFREIARDGYTTNYLTFIINTPKEVDIVEADILLPTHLEWIPWSFGGDLKCYFKLKKTNQKTKNKFVIEILEPKISQSILKPIYDRHFQNCDCPDSFLTPVPTKTWEWWLCFGCKICGTRFFCDCFKVALAKERETAEKCKDNYGESGWPHKFLSNLENKNFRPNICHICTGTPSDLVYCHEMYGSKIKVHYGYYIKKTAIENSIDEREAENIIREKIGVPKIGEGWINETQLYKIVCALFPGRKVLREASPNWLGKQRFDVFLPELSLAIEYQGQQHYKPVALFGGETGLENAKKRDALKKSLCKTNKVRLVYFKYDENVTEVLVERRLKKYLNEILTPE